METSAFGAATSAIARRSFDETISALDAEMSELGAAMSAIARSYWQYRRGVSGDIGDCGVRITLQIYYRVTNHGDMSTFSKPDWVNVSLITGNFVLLLTSLVIALLPLLRVEAFSIS